MIVGRRISRLFLQALTSLCCFLAGAALAVPAVEICLPGGGAPFLLLHGDRVLEGPDGTLVWEGPAESATGLACAGALAVVGVRQGERGKLVWLERAASAWTVVKETGTRGVPIFLTMTGDRVAAVAIGRKDSELVVDTRSSQRPVERSLPGEPSCLASSPDGKLLLVGRGSRIVTYRAENTGTWVVFELEDEITGCATRPGVPWVLISQGTAVVAVDPRDRPDRGRLPRRAEVELGGTIEKLAWTGGGELVTVSLADPPRLVHLRGNDLSLALEKRVAQPVAALAGVAAGWVVTADAEGRISEHRVPDELLAAARPPARVLPAPVAPEPEPEPALDVRAEPAAPPKPPSVPEVKPAPAPVPEVKLEPVVPPKLAPVPDVKPAPVPAPVPEVKLEPVDAPKPPSVPEVKPEPVPAPVPEVKPDPVDAPKPPIVPEVKPEPVPAPEVRAEPVVPPKPPSVPDVKPEPVPAPEARAEPGRTLRGVLTGRVALVAEIVVLGPDSILSELARVSPRSEGGVTLFVLENVPPGSYRLIPMGERGSSLAARPPMAVVAVEEERGGRADFEIVKPLP